MDHVKRDSLAQVSAIIAPAQRLVSLCPPLSGTEELRLLRPQFNRNDWRVRQVAKQIQIVDSQLSNIDRLSAILCALLLLSERVEFRRGFPVIYAEDPHMEALGKRVGIDIRRICDLPLPTEEEETLFSRLKEPPDSENGDTK